jgi:hypothetical protein
MGGFGAPLTFFEYHGQAKQFLPATHNTAHKRDTLERRFFAVAEP